MSLSVIYFVVVADVNASGDIPPFDSSTYFISDASPQKSSVTGNPLDYAGERIGLDVRNIELPRGHEGGYRFACRFPVIDYVSYRPLYMKQWAEESAESITASHRGGGVGVVEKALEILRGTSEYMTVASSGDRHALDEFRERLSRSDFTPAYQKVLTDLYQGYTTACGTIDQARRNLTEDDIEFFGANPGYFLAPDGKTMPPLTGNVDSHFEFIERSRRVAYEYIFYAAEVLSDAIERYVDATKGYRRVSDFFADPSRSQEVFEVETPLGLVRIGGFGNDIHERDAGIMIDHGGDDVYTNNAGGCRSGDIGAALCIDR